MQYFVHQGDTLLTVAINTTGSAANAPAIAALNYPNYPIALDAILEFDTPLTIPDSLVYGATPALDIDIVGGTPAPTSKHQTAILLGCLIAAYVLSYRLGTH